MADEQSIFLRALELASDGERGQYLDEACDGDAELRSRVEALIARHFEDSRFLEPNEREPGVTVTYENATSAADPSTQETFLGQVDAVEASPRRLKPGSTVRYIGDYEILAEIARGGMGVVFKARQVRLKRVVALKMILSGEFASDADVRRFHTEAESAAQLDHPHIVPVYEVGEYQGVHYFSMGFVDGHPMSARIAEAPYAPRDAAKVVQALGEAVQYAHDHGVIHRDLKPGNVLIDKSGQPRITDFGLAKQTKGNSSLTGTGFILGTPSYMPPEQATGRLDLTREPADVYSLGAILYAALTGRPPFQADNALETLRQVAQREPVAPRQLNPNIPRDLETICLKCLEKPIHRRYSTARELAEELGRFLDGKPILARPVRTHERLWKWCRRNRTIATLLTTVAASLVIGTIVSTYFAIEADRRADENLTLANENRELAVQETKARGEAEAAREVARENERIAVEQTRIAQIETANLSLNEAVKLLEQSEENSSSGLLWIAAAYERAMSAGDADLADACRAMASLWLPQTMRLVNVHPGTKRTSVAYGVDDRTIIRVDWAFERHATTQEDERSIATALQNGLYVLDSATGAELEHITNVRSPTAELAVSLDRTRILLLDAEHQPRIWSLTEKQWIGQPITSAGKIEKARFSGDGWRLVTATLDGHFEFWNGTTGESTGIKFQHELPANNTAIAFCQPPTGTMIYTAGGKGDIRTWDPNNGQEIGARKDGLRGAVDLMSWTPTIGPFATFRTKPNRIITHWSNAQTDVIAEVPTQRVRAMAHSPNGRWLAEVGDKNQLMVRTADFAHPVSPPANLSQQPLSVQFNSTSDRVLLATMFGAVNEWELAPKLHRRYQRENLDSHQRQFLYRDPRNTDLYSVSVGGNGYQKIRRLAAEESTEDFTELPRLLFASVAPGGKFLIGVTEEGEAFSVEIASGETKFAGVNHAEKVRSFHHSPTGDCFATLCSSELRLWRTSDASAIGESTPIIRLPFIHKHHVQFSRDGKLVSVSGFERDGRCHVLSTVDGSPVEEPISIPGMTFATIDPSGTRLLVGFWGRLELWNREPLERIQVLGQHSRNIVNVGCGLENELAYSLGEDRVVRVWNLATGKRVGRPMTGIDPTAKLFLRPDGKWLGVYLKGEIAEHWHVASGRRLGAPVMGLSGQPYWQGFEELGYSHDSKEFVAWSPENTYPLLNTPTDPQLFRTFLELWIGQTLEGNDARSLLGQSATWAKRRERLLEAGINW